MKIPVQCVRPTMEESSPSLNLNVFKSASGGISGNKPNEEGNQKLQYSIPGILHFIQHEWARFEMERSQWEVDRAELLAKIAFLQGERKGQENLKNDLVRRIKMLEYALKQERAKYHKLKYGSDLNQGDLKAPTFEDTPEIAADADTPFSSVSNMTWKQGRQMLRQYLQEIGYTDAILDVRSNRVRSLLGLNNNEEGVNGSEGGGAGKRCSESQGGRRTPGAKGVTSLTEAMVVDTEDAVMASFEFLGGGTGPPVDIDDDDIDEMEDDSMHKHDQTAIEARPTVVVDRQELPTYRDGRKIPKYKGVRSRFEAEELDPETEEVLNEMNRLLHESNDEGSNDINEIIDDQCDWGSLAGGKGLGSIKREGDAPLDSSLGLGELAQLTVNNEADSAYDVPTSKETFRKVWNVKYTLRSHFDGVRALAFHPQEPVLITASDDHTLKLWNLQKTIPAKKSASLDVEPLYTFRGHTSPVICLCMSPTGEQCYSGSTNGSIHCWNLPSPNIDPYDSFESSVLKMSLVGHTDAVWRLICHQQRQQLLSCSADGTIKLWSTGKQHQLLHTFTSELDGTPTCVDFAHDESDKMVAAFTSGQCVVFDLETGKSVMRLESSQDMLGGGEGARGGAIYRLVCHPLLGITVTAHEDRHIRFLDHISGKMVHSMVAHLDAVTSLAIDPNALYLLSGSHDCSIRLWNLENKTCVQEITAHRKKFDEAILDVAFHPTKPFIASAGADALAKVFV